MTQTHKTLRALTEQIEQREELIAGYQTELGQLTKERDKCLVDHLHITGEDAELTLAQTALFMDLTEGRVRNLLSAKKLISRKVGDEHFIASEDCRAYMAKTHKKVTKREVSKRDEDLVEFVRRTGHNQLFTTVQAALYLNCSQSIIHNATGYDALQSVKVGGCLMIEKEWCDEFQRNYRKKAVA